MKAEHLPFAPIPAGHSREGIYDDAGLGLPLAFYRVGRGGYVVEWQRSAKALSKLWLGEIKSR